MIKSCKSVSHLGFAFPTQTEGWEQSAVVGEGGGGENLGID